MQKKQFHQKAAPNEIFVRNKAHISRYLKRITKLFEDVILIHGIQASIQKCVRIALAIQDQYCGITYRIRTSSQHVDEGKIRSAIHIELQKQLII